MEDSKIHFFKYRSGLLFFTLLLVVSVALSFIATAMPAHEDLVYFIGFSIAVPTLLTWIIVKIEKRCQQMILKLFLGLFFATLLLSYLIIY